MANTVLYVINEKNNSLKRCVRTTVINSTKTAKIKKADITFAAHCNNVNVFLSNMSFFDFCCFSRVNDCRPYTPF